jgi:hypothetical protein
MVGVPGLIEGKKVEGTHYRADLYAHCMGMCIGTYCSFFVPGAWIAAWFKEWIDRPDDPTDWEANKIGRLCRKMVDKGYYSDCAACCEGQLKPLGYAAMPQNEDMMFP